MIITFEPLHESHFPLLLKWLETPHVKKWWDQDVTYTMDLVREKYSSYVKGYKLVDGQQKSIQGFIIHNNQNPIGYIQIYNAYDFPRSKTLSGLSANLGAFDLFIGEESALQQGLGSKAIVEFLKLHGNQYSYIFADPDINNVVAVKCYERAGFKKVSEQADTGEVWMLLKNKVLSVNNVEHFVWGNLCDGWWLKKGGNFTVIEEMMPPGGLEVKHFHNLTEQFFYVLNGTLYMEIDDHEYKLDNNQGIEIPAGAVHQVLNKSKDSVRFLVISCPDSHNDRVNVEENENISIGPRAFDESKILDELKSREPIFHHPEKFGKTKQDIENQICDEFWEVGASGNVYTKQDVIETLLERYNNPDYQDIWEAKDFELTKIAPDNYLLTYIFIQDQTRVTRRSTLWRKVGGNWKILYHQGTVIDGGSV